MTRRPSADPHLLLLVADMHRRDRQSFLRAVKRGACIALIAANQLGLVGLLTRFLAILVVVLSSGLEVALVAAGVGGDPGLVRVTRALAGVTAAAFPFSSAVEGALLFLGEKGAERHVGLVVGSENVVGTSFFFHEQYCFK